MYRVRFNLEAGPHFMHWQVKKGDSVEFHSPDAVQLVMQQCQLKNNSNIAHKIWKGKNKRVCAWIECEQLEVLPFNEVHNSDYECISYNPRNVPFWTNEHYMNLDDDRYAQIFTSGRKLFASKWL